MQGGWGFLLLRTGREKIAQMQAPEYHEVQEWKLVEKKFR